MYFDCSSHQYIRWPQNRKLSQVVRGREHRRVLIKLKNTINFTATCYEFHCALTCLSVTALHLVILDNRFDGKKRALYPTNTENICELEIRSEAVLYYDDTPDYSTPELDDPTLSTYESESVSSSESPSSEDASRSSMML